MADLKPAFFETANDFRAWLEAHHDRETALEVGFRKKGSGLPSMAYQEALDEALCFGWIDGVRHGIDTTSYATRFSPRKKGSTWSAINVRRVGELARAGRMHAAGLRAFEARDESKTNRYSNEQESVELGEAYEAVFRTDQEAWQYWESQPAGYRRAATWWVTSAKREDTRQRRLAQLMADSAARKRVDALMSPAQRLAAAQRGRTES